eukprot:767213-Pyramimonas_sp.AAC.1
MRCFRVDAVADPPGWKPGETTSVVMPLQGIGATVRPYLPKDRRGNHTGVPRPTVPASERGSHDPWAGGRDPWSTPGAAVAPSVAAVPPPPPAGLVETDL